MTGDPLWMKGLLAVHVVAGVSAFVIAPVVLSVAKGGRTHKAWGMVYLWCMGVVAGAALPMALFRPVFFLAMVAVFSFYAAFAGYRVLKLKDLSRGGRAKAIDWIAAGITFAASALLAYLSWFHPRLIQTSRIVGVVFGLLGMRLSYSQMSLFVRKPKEKMFWWYDHLGMFIGSYIAAWTAFSVVTLSQFVGGRWWVWLWPAMVGVPAIIVTIAYYKRKFTPKRPVEAVAAS